MHLRHLAILLTATATVFAQEAAPAAKSPLGPWVEPDFPFFSSVLDCRDLGEGFPKDNLTPRGLILNLGHNLWACFDTDLLRIACIWEGKPGEPPVTPAALAPGSYHSVGWKTKDGQDFLPKPNGKVWLANGLYPGWQVGEKPSFTDPREKAPSVEEVGRGPLDGKFLSVEEHGDRLLLKFSVGNAEINEIMEADKIGDELVVMRLVIVMPRDVGLTCSINHKVHARKPSDVIAQSTFSDTLSCIEMDGGELSFLKASPHQEIDEALFIMTKDGLWRPSGAEADVKSGGSNRSNPGRKWPQILSTTAKLSTSTDAYVFDDIPLLFDNPWKRHVRLADIDFLNDQGDAVGVTFDGDVWLISGLKGDLEKVTWKRFASGLHEPMSIVARKKNQDSGIKNQELFVFDRNGIWRLVDSNADQECDSYEMFCNLFAQTAETREFPNSMKLGPKGELYISKGGQEGTTRGKHNGTVIKVAPDGKSFEVIGYGLRQPFIGVNEKTGLVTASDQQGHYVPSTPLHIIEKGHFYGHLPTIAPKEKYPAPITEPMTWIPHPVNPSGVTQTWLTGAKMGDMNDELIHIGYNRPELFRVLINDRFERKQAAVVSFSRELDFPLLNAKVNPADGQLYVTGFQVWGTTTKVQSGLARVRYTGKPRVLLKQVTPTDAGLVLTFNHALDAAMATNPDSYSAERWNYKRTPEYGSPHLKPDGSGAGQEWMTASSAYLSQDGKNVLVAFPGMKAGIHQMRIGWGLKSADGLKAENTAYFTPWELLSFKPADFGFAADLKPNLTPRQVAAVSAVKPTVEEGARIYQMFGCMACHSRDGSNVGKVGPSWKGLFGSERDIAKGMKGKVKADEAYLRESILNPAAKVVKGFEKFDTGMPIYNGILNDSQVESLVMFIKGLK
ncbi:MAG: c-type cytochrome [Verrucomicrobiaceae bacterium]|nr:c-type cytochrome [Verrucomicrobiaceae bacterium]